MSTRRENAGNVSEDSIVQAWLSLDAGKSPENVHLLASTGSSHVFGLTGASPEATDVVAKYTCRELAKAESFVYEKVLPRIDISVPRYYGSVQLFDDPGMDLLFMSYVDGIQYSPEIQAHGTLASKYLARLHSAGRRAGLWGSLPLRSPAFYVERLKSIRERLTSDVPELSADDSTRIGDLLCQLDILSAEWALVEAHVHDLPWTLVHTDFLGRNLRVDPRNNVLTAFDWVGARWGPPAVDLGQAAIPMKGYSVGLQAAPYLATASELPPNLTAQTFECHVALGKILWYLQCINGDAKGLGKSWHRRAVEHIAIYTKELAKAWPIVTSTRPAR